MPPPLSPRFYFAGRWARSIVLARRKEDIRHGILLLLRVYGAHASRLRRQAFFIWLAGFEDDKAVVESVVSLPPPAQHVAAGEILKTTCTVLPAPNSRCR